jgi:hypothetical protein
MGELQIISGNGRNPSEQEDGYALDMLNFRGVDKNDLQ